MDSMGSMGDAGGMDAGGSTMFRSTNMKIARSFWYVVAGVLGLLALRRLVDHFRPLEQRHRSASRGLSALNPFSTFLQIYDTLLTVLRELSYPALHPFHGRVSRFFTPPALGNWLFLVTYWSMILVMLWTNTILSPSSALYAYKWEIVGFRAAWVSVTQVPLIYALSSKFNIITLTTGLSYERLNWLHRWVARTLFLTVIVHWSFFFREWALADFVSLELQMMPMVKYGFGAWAVLGWCVVSSFGIVRAHVYELWFVQHVLSGIMLLWLLYCHVPYYARYNIWLAIALMSFDRAVRIVRSIWINTNFSVFLSAKGSRCPWLGFDAYATVSAGDYVRIRVTGVKFKWKAAQHVFISLPRYGIFQSHPFTIANTPHETSHDPLRELDIFIKCHNGLTKRLLRDLNTRERRVKAFLSNPWGNPPYSDIRRCNTLIFVATSTGASFTVPLFQFALDNARHMRRVDFHWVIRHPQQLGWFEEQLNRTTAALRRNSITVYVTVYITGSDATTETHCTHGSAQLLHNHDEGGPIREKIEMTAMDSTVEIIRENRSDDDITTTESRGSTHNEERQLQVSYGRPESLDRILLPAIEDAEGETLIVACGNKGLLSRIRNWTAYTSDHRGVHKGTGAQSIRLFTESYGL